MDSTEDWSGDCRTPLENETHENERQEIEQIVPGYPNFDNYVQESFDAVRAGIKAANSLPVGSDFRYYSCFPSFLDARDRNIKMVLNVMQRVLATVGIKNNISKRGVDEKFDLLLETNDILLDRANELMDKECGVMKNSEVELVVTRTNKQIVNGSWNNRICQPPQQTDNTQPVRLLAGRNVQRPQLMFKDKIDNSSKPWSPKIKDKPNSLKPLAIYTEESENGEVFSHPYEFELDMFSPPMSQLKKCEPKKYKSLEETPLVIIENSVDIKLLLEDLKRYKEIAVDLEHHSYRSFQGITCLMQISTGDADYLIDTLSLRSELHELNEIFTKPTILKVFHGADLDIQWLQRDLSLYIVNMFDTHQAAKQLNLPYLSLAYLLKQYCNIDPNKHFQLADWRIRPLPEELQKYAREDTHYLLYIKDILRNALIDAANGQINILKSVYDRSTDICKKTYVKPIWIEENCMSIYRKSQKMFNNKQLYALIELHKWRDITAREEDDSTAYVLPNHMLLNIAETLPREMQGILACCNPIPPLVRQNLLKLHKIILKAREQPLIKPVLDDLRQRLSQRNQITNSEAWIYSPHDIPHDMEARADLPCLLDNVNVLEIANPSNVTVKRTVTVFDSPITSEDEKTSKNNQEDNRKRKFIFVSPFERYKRVIPMIAEEEAREREKQKQEEEEDRLDKLKKVDEETEESKQRVYEHFKQVSLVPNQQTATTPSTKKTPLSKMRGCKRKRSSNIDQEKVIEEEKKTTDNLITSIPSLETKIVRDANKKSYETERLDKEGNVEGSVARIRNNIPDNVTNSIRSRKKGEKKRVIDDLNKQNMLPSKKFDYKAVDFSSFQGGSKNIPGQEKQVNFEQRMQKKEKRRKKKKQKFNI